MSIPLRLFFVFMLSIWGMHSTKVSALTTADFFKICQASTVACAEHPVLQAYIGGSLDMLAALDEETNYLGKLYCDAPKKLFKIPSIIDFMQIRSKRYAEHNAMVLVILYLEQNGGCKRDDH